MQEYIEDYAEFAINDISRVISANTIRSYKTDLRDFFSFYRKDMSCMTQGDVQDYVRHLKGRADGRTGGLLSVKTINRKLVALNQFLGYMKRERGLEVNVVVRQEKVQHQNILPEMLENSDVKRMLAAAERAGDLRAKAVICTLFFTGARVSEALQIRVRDVAHDEVWIVGKGSKHRRLFIPGRLSDVWREHLGASGMNSPDGSLFSGQKGPLTRQTVHKMLKLYAGRARLSRGKVHAHAFRHLYAKNISNLGVSSAVLKQLLGHQLSTTEIYMQVSKKELFGVIERIGLFTE